MRKYNPGAALPMIQDLYDTGKAIYDQTARLCAHGEEDRLKLATLLERIGHLVSDTAAKLRQGQLPASKSHQLELLSDELYFRLTFSIGEVKARTLAGKLMHGYTGDRLQSEPAVNGATDQDLTLLEAAAGYFLATSEQLRTA